MINTKSNQKGTAMTELVCMVALIAIAALAAIGSAGISLSDTFESTATSMNSNRPVIDLSRPEMGTNLAGRGLNRPRSAGGSGANPARGLSAAR